MSGRRRHDNDIGISTLQQASDDPDPGQLRDMLAQIGNKPVVIDSRELTWITTTTAAANRDRT
jgi:hypothetical protein